VNRAGQSVEVSSVQRHSSTTGTSRCPGSTLEGTVLTVEHHFGTIPVNGGSQREIERKRRLADPTD